MRELSEPPNAVSARPPPARADKPAAGVARQGSVGLRGVLTLQGQIGNAGTSRWLAAIQRAGNEVIQRQDAGAPVCNPPGTQRVAGSPADSVAAAVAANCLDEAYAIIYSRSMVDLLSLFDALRTRPEYATIRSTAAARGGPRLTLAIKAVDLHARGTPVTGAELRGLIDDMGGLPTDQRRNIMQYLGKYAVITVQGIDIDFSYCKGTSGVGCVAEITAEKKWGQKMQQEYGACRKPGIKNSTDVENCKDASLAAQGVKTVQAGGTSSTGVVTVAAQPMTQCQPVLDRGTEIHEAVHQRTTLAMQKKFGGNTPAFKAAWHEANSWIDDEIKAYGAEIPFYDEVLKAIAQLEGKL